MLDLVKSWARQAHVGGAMIFLWAVSLAFGIAMILLIPVGAGQDEDTHLVRVWELSDFSFLPQELSARQLRYPAIFEEISYRNQVLLPVIGADFWATYGGLRLFDHGFFYGPLGTRSLYSPPLLLPQALVMRYLGRKHDLPALTIFYACRFAGLLSYVILASLAIRLVPFGKWILAVLAVSPMALFQASTITADTISNGIGLLFIAGTLQIAQREQLGWKEWLSLALLVSALFLTKVNGTALILLPLLAIGPAKFRKRSAYWLMLVMIVLLFLLEVVGWNLLTYGYFSEAPQPVDPAAQLVYVLRHPITIAIVLLKNLFTNGLYYLQDWIGVYGYGYWTVPWITYLLFVAALIGTLFIDPDGMRTGKKARIALAATFVAGYLATALSLYLVYNLVGSPYIYGLHGRYLIVFAPLPFLACAGPTGMKGRFRPSLGWVIVCLVGSVLSFCLGIVLSYHVQCGTAFYRTSLCYQPVYKNFSPTSRYSQPISAGTVLAQEIHPVCNGMTELHVWTSRAQPEDAGTTQFVLLDSAADRMVIDTRIANSQIPQGGWYSLRFAADWQSAGKTYIFKIIGLDSPAGQGLKVAYSLKPEYPLGTLYENGRPAEDDIIFRYGCIAGLRKILQTGKP